MSAPGVWRVEFDRDAARDLRKLGLQAERLILRYLRQRIATTEDPRRFLFYELYDDQAALDAHRASAHYERFVTNGLLKLIETRVSGLFTTIS